MLIVQALDHSTGETRTRHATQDATGLESSQTRPQTAKTINTGTRREQHYRARRSSLHAAKPRSRNASEVSRFARLID